VRGLESEIETLNKEKAELETSVEAQIGNRLEIMKGKQRLLEDKLQIYSDKYV